MAVRASTLPAPAASPALRAWAMLARFRSILHRPMAPTFHSDDAKLVRRNRWWLALGASPFLLAITAIVAAIVVGHPGIAVPALHTSVLGTVALSWLWRRNKNPVFVSGGI